MNITDTSSETQGSVPHVAEALEFTYYRPNQRHELGLLQTWVVMSKNVWRSRELIWQLFKRDFLAQHKKSFIGYSWIFLTPILGIVSCLGGRS